MGVVRRGTFRPIDNTDYETLLTFVHELRTHNMYRGIVEDMKSRPGFVRKEHTMRETKEGQEFISQVEFEDQETFNSYMNSEEIVSLWEYLKISAEMSDLTHNVEDIKD
jgi:heme-degrading monooxygenase HmoA